jgi:hypothetical protein
MTDSAEDGRTVAVKLLKRQKDIDEADREATVMRYDRAIELSNENNYLVRKP